MQLNSQWTDGSTKGLPEHISSLLQQTENAYTSTTLSICEDVPLSLLSIIYYINLYLNCFCRCCCKLWSHITPGCLPRRCGKWPWWGSNSPRRSGSLKEIWRTPWVMMRCWAVHTQLLESVDPTSDCVFAGSQGMDPVWERREGSGLHSAWLKFYFNSYLKSCQVIKEITFPRNYWRDLWDKLGWQNYCGINMVQIAEAERQATISFTQVWLETACPLFLSSIKHKRAG